jgi:hypothetical protein
MSRFFALKLMVVAVALVALTHAMPSSIPPCC